MIIKLIELIVVATFAVAATIYIYTQGKEKKVKKLSFRESIDLTDLPIITLQNNGNKYNFLLDTGSSNCVIDKTVFEHNIINHTMCNKTDAVYGVDGVARKTSMANITFSVDTLSFNDDFNILDISDALENVKRSSGVTLHGIIGGSVFQKYNFIIDFKEYVAYAKK